MGIAFCTSNKMRKDILSTKGNICIGKVSSKGYKTAQIFWEKAISLKVGMQEEYFISVIDTKWYNWETKVCMVKEMTWIRKTLQKLSILSSLEYLK